MFKCEVCGKTTEPNERAIHKVTEKREKTYYAYVCPKCGFKTSDENIDRCPNCFYYKDGEKKHVNLQTKIEGRGWEIKQEVLACQNCGGK